MNRFFSKLNLGDIKISPEGNRFPPDADEREPAPGTTAIEAASETTDVPVPSPANEHPEWEGEVDVEASIVSDLRNDPVAPVEPIQAQSVDVHEHTDTAEAQVSILENTEPYVIDTPVTLTNGHAEATTSSRSWGESDDIVMAPGEVLKVSARSRPSAVAGAIAGVVREVGKAEVQAIGAGATNQAIKAVAIARDYLSETGIDAVCVPAFIDVTIDNEDRTAIRLVVEPRH